jgi:hypothetical protein
MDSLPEGIVGWGGLLLTAAGLLIAYWAYRAQVYRPARKWPVLEMSIKPADHDWAAIWVKNKGDDEAAHLRWEICVPVALAPRLDISFHDPNDEPKVRLGPHCIETIKGVAHYVIGQSKDTPLGVGSKWRCLRIRLKEEWSSSNQNPGAPMTVPLQWRVTAAGLEYPEHGYEALTLNLP